MDKKILFLLLSICLGLFLLKGNVFSLELNVESEKVDEINQEIDKYQQDIEDLKEEEEIYEQKIQNARKDVKSLENEIYILKTQIAQKESEIKRKQKEIDSQTLIIENIQKKILKQEKKLQEIKNQIKHLIQILNLYDNKKPLGMLFLENSLSQVLNQFRYLNSLHSKINDSLKASKTIKEGLGAYEVNLREELADLVSLKKDLRDSRASLQAQEQSKELILDQTRGVEWRFQSLLADVIKKQENIEREIKSLEQQARKEIKEKQEKIAQKLMEEEGRVIFSWPVPSTFITATFHDPDYPFRHWLGEHSAIDIRASQGTPIRAPAAGYVARAKYGGMGYSYIMIIHNDEFSTLYGHVSEFFVEEGEYVKRGDLIAKSGGMPGTPGAGRFSTGPHLHFGVRLNGVPVNPEDYLL